MRTILWTTALALIFVVCSAPVRAVPSHDLGDLESKALRSLRIEYAFLIDPAADTGALVGNVGPGCRERSAKERWNDIARRRTVNAEYGLRFIDAQVSVAGGTVRAVDDGLVLRTTERADLTFETRTGPGVTSARTPHDFVFEQTEGRWILVFDRATEMGRPLPAL